MKPGTQMRFVGEGNQPANQLPGDLIITIGEIEHESIRREGNNLIYRHKIGLADALTVAAVEF